MKKTILLSISIVLVTAVSFFTYMYFNMCNYEEKAEQKKKTEMQDSCCKKNVTGEADKPLGSFQTEITCPECKFKKTETLPTEICQLVYTCSNCNKELKPKEGDCCVFCSYGTHKCPSKQ
ncbi:MAG: hypothetical protein K0S32_158 [Bacteroidetes bacterium]|jgi:hypothetical protein|nr:hypothetical protein [Bacteroidota bacterium]